MEPRFRTRKGDGGVPHFTMQMFRPFPSELKTKRMDDNAYTINEQGVTLVPLEVKVLEDGEVYIRAKDPDYAHRTGRSSEILGSRYIHNSIKGIQP